MASFANKLPICGICARLRVSGRLASLVETVLLFSLRRYVCLNTIDRDSPLSLTFMSSDVIEGVHIYIYIYSAHNSWAYS